MGASDLLNEHFGAVTHVEQNLVARRIWSITAIGSQLNLTWRQKADLTVLAPITQDPRLPTS